MRGEAGLPAAAPPDLACDIATSAAAPLRSLEVTRGRPPSWQALWGPGRWSRCRSSNCAPATGRAPWYHLQGGAARDVWTGACPAQAHGKARRQALIVTASPWPSRRLDAWHAARSPHLAPIAAAASAQRPSLPNRLASHRMLAKRARTFLATPSILSAVPSAGAAKGELTGCVPSPRCSQAASWLRKRGTLASTAAVEWHAHRRCRLQAGVRRMRRVPMPPALATRGVHG